MTTNTTRQEERPTVILGAGITGLRTAQLLSNNKRIIVLEKRKHTGGLSTSFKYKDFTFDIGPHKIYSIIPGIMQQFRNIMEEDCLTINKKNSIHLLKHSYKFPLNPIELATHFNPLKAIQCGLSYASTLTKRKTKEYVISYEDYFLNGFGKATYELLFKDIANKVWGDPKKLTAELAERRIPLPSIIKMAQQMFTKKIKPEISAAQFYYPKNGMGSLCDKMTKEIRTKRGRILTEMPPTSINVTDSKVTSVTIKDKNEETRLQPENVISTIHLIDLIALIKPTPPKEVMDAAKKLKYRSLILVYIILNKEKAMTDNWIFFPEKEYIFTRVSEQKNFSKHTGPQDKTAIIAEIGCEFEDETYNLPDKELAQKAIQDMEKAGIIKKEEVNEYFTLKINRCYPVYEIGYKENLAKILNHIRNITNLYTIGRQGLFNYNNIDHSLDMANKLTEQIMMNKTKEEWEQTTKIFDDYKIVD